MEVQIRTQEMHHTAEHGIAAHWRYKEKKPLGAADAKSFAWLNQLMEWQRDLKDPTEFIETVKIDLFEEEVFVFTPKGDVKALPKGATPIDFAYAVHSKIGAHCSGARVNGIIVPLRYPLRNGDTIEILTSTNQKPSKDWLKFVVTSRARTRIRHSPAHGIARPQHAPRPRSAGQGAARAQPLADRRREGGAAGAGRPAGAGGLDRGPAGAGGLRQAHPGPGRRGRLPRAGDGATPPARTARRCHRPRPPGCTAGRSRSRWPGSGSRARRTSW